MTASKMIAHTAVFSNGKTKTANFKKAFPFCVQSVNVQIREDGTELIQTLYSFSSKNAAKNLFGKFSGVTTNEVVAVSFE
jgi:hypothetical protein